MNRYRGQSGWRASHVRGIDMPISPRMLVSLISSADYLDCALRTRRQRSRALGREPLPEDIAVAR
jgi:hypothetical protein